MRFLLIIFFSWIIIASQAQNEKLNCEDAITQAEMNACTAKELQIADSILDSTFDLLMIEFGQYISSLDSSENSFQWYIKLRVNLVESQLIWTELRLRNAEFYNILYEGGSIRSMAITLSKINDTYERIDKLNNYSNSMK